MNAEDSRMHYKIACTYMNESAWPSAIKCLHTALRTQTAKSTARPDYNLALGQCYMQVKNTAEALVCFSNVVKFRPKNISGWTEFLKCLLYAEHYEEGLLYAQAAYEHTENKPLFLYFKSMFLFAAGKIKEAALQLENALAINPKLIKKYIDLNPSVLSNRQIVEIIARNRKKNPR